jgi:hypothetical protein
MGRYRLKPNAGAHHHSDGRVYGPGDVIDSPANLALLFREKFEVVNGPQPVFVGPAGGRTGNEQPSDFAARDVFETDAAADAQARSDNANLSDNDGVDTDEEDLAENIANNEAGTGKPVDVGAASSGRPKRNAATTAAAASAKRSSSTGRR